MKNLTCVWRNIYNTARATHSRYYKHFAKHACDFSLILLEPCNFLYKLYCLQKVSDIPYNVILWHFIGSRLDFEYPYIFTILYIFTMENIWQIHVFCPRLARARVGSQDKQVITHYGPPTLLAVAPMTRRFTQISGSLTSPVPRYFAPLPPPLSPVLILAKSTPLNSTNQ